MRARSKQSCGHSGGLLRGGEIARLVWHHGLLALAVSAWLLASPHQAFAVNVEAASRPLARRILALFDGAHEPVAHATRIHRFAEMPLNHLGFVVTYHNVRETLPEPGQLAGVHAVLTWFLEPLEQPLPVLRFIEAATAAGSRHVVLGEVAPQAAGGPNPVARRLLRNLGLQDDGLHASITYKARVGAIDRAMIGFERALDGALPEFPILAALPGAARVHLGVDVPVDGSVRSAAVVATSARGGYAAQGFTIYYEPSTDRVAWIIDPFAFFQAALGSERRPVPDTTTVSGRRMYFSHIDGDGWNNVSEIAPYRDQQLLSSEVILKDAILAYPDLPVSVGLIAGDVRSNLGGSRAARRVARQLFALPQVEVASHTYTHPFDWSFFERYDRAREEAMVEQSLRPVEPLREQLTGLMRRLAGVETPRRASDKYIAGSDDLPRSYMKEPFDLDREVSGALAVSESLAPVGKRARLYLWSGDTTPFEGAIAATRAAGVRNLNGGDSRLDAAYPSVAYVPPLSRPAGRERQIYAANSNENTYTNDWTGPYSGFHLLSETLRNTDAPRRLKPFNLYYHMYSGEKPGALSAIRRFLDEARRGPIAPVAASTYAAIADDFFGVEMVKVGPNAWTIANRGEVQTVRFDAADRLAVDLVASRGVLGATRHAGALYVALDAGEAIALVSLAEEVVPGPAVAESAATTGPGEALIEARWRLSKRRAQPCGLVIAADGYGPGEMVWTAPPGRAYALEARAAGETLWRGSAETDSAGRLAFVVEANAIDGLELVITCRSDAP